APMSVRRSVIETQKLDPDSVLIEAVATNGEKYYFSDLLNWIVFENLTERPYSIFAYVAALLPPEAKPLLPDVNEIVSHAARTAGTRRYGVPRLPPQHQPRKMPRAAVEEHWRLVRDELVASERRPADWPYDLAVAAQWQMVTSQDKLPLAL